MAALTERLIFFAGIGQVGVLIASALVPFRLNWRSELRLIPKLHRQMYWVYGGYVAMSIIAFAAFSISNPGELAGGSALARGLCAWIAAFWGIRAGLQAVFDVHQYLTAWWLRIGYFALTLMFTALAIVYTWAALEPLT